ncbi:MAG: PAS domain-containing protein, partial [Acidobacteriota bacterium]
PNGGSSLYDKITSTELRTLTIAARTDWLCDQLDRPNFECAADGANVRINASFTTQFGYSPAEMLGQRWVRMIHDDDRERVMNEWAHAIDDRRMFESSYRAKTRAGVVMRVRVIAEPQPHPTTGAILRWLGRIEIVKSETGAAA